MTHPPRHPAPSGRRAHRGGRAGQASVRADGGRLVVRSRPVASGAPVGPRGRSAVRRVPSEAHGEADDAGLLAAVAGGDRNAPLSELYRRYGPRLYGLGLRLLGDASLAEELVQETFVRLWRNASRYDPERSGVGTYVFTLARSVAVDLWRRPSSRPFAPEPEGDVLVQGDAVDRVVAELTVRDGLDSLSAAHREVLELAYRKGLTQAEIAAELAIPLGTVKTRTYHALRALRGALDERGLRG